MSSPEQKWGACGHLMAYFAQHAFCGQCRGRFETGFTTVHPCIYNRKNNGQEIKLSVGPKAGWREGIGKSISKDKPMNLTSSQLARINSLKLLFPINLYVIKNQIKIYRKQLCTSNLEGGLKMIDIDIFIKGKKEGVDY